MCRTAWALENQMDNIARLAFSTMMCKERVRSNIEVFTFVVLVKYLIQSESGGLSFSLFEVTTPTKI